jgi:hypothetical protein
MCPASRFKDDPLLVRRVVDIENVAKRVVERSFPNANIRATAEDGYIHNFQANFRLKIHYDLRRIK